MALVELWSSWSSWSSLQTKQPLSVLDVWTRRATKQPALPLSPHAALPRRRSDPAQRPSHAKIARLAHASIPAVPLLDAIKASFHPARRLPAPPFDASIMHPAAVSTARFQLLAIPNRLRSTLAQPQESGMLSSSKRRPMPKSATPE